MQIYILMSDDRETQILDSPPQLLHINNCDLSFTFYQWESEKYSKRKKAVNWTAVMKEQAWKQRMQRGYSIYGLCTNTFFIEMRVRLQRKALTLDTSMIQCWGCLKFRMCNPGKITKYTVLVRMVCEAVLGYILLTYSFHGAESFLRSYLVLQLVK